MGRRRKARPARKRRPARIERLRRNNRHSGARAKRASPESITTTGSLDSGPAPSGHPGMKKSAATAALSAFATIASRGKKLLVRCGLAILLLDDARRLAAATAQVIQLGAPHLALA